MTFGTPSRAELDKLEARAETCRTRCETYLTEKRAAGVSELSDSDAVTFRGLLASHTEATRRAADYASELQRATLPPHLAHLGEARAVNSGSRVAPIGFDIAELRAAHDRLKRGESVRLEASLGYATATADLPPTLAPWVTELQHEGRISDRLPAFAIDTPSIEIIQVNSVTGAAGVVAEGAVKPEIVPVTTPLTVVAKKVACHVGMSYEALSDFDAFSNYVRIELQRQVIQAENLELLYGDGTTARLNGFFGQANILTFDATTADQDIDAIEQAISAMRVGPSLATPDLCVLNPATWSGIRRSKDAMERYLLSADPSAAEASSIWGIEVVTATQCQPGDGLLVDTRKYGRAIVREPLSMRIGFANDDFIKNVLRTVSETRLNNAIERPSSVLWVKNLGVPPVTRSKSKAKSD